MKEMISNETVRYQIDADGQTSGMIRNAIINGNVNLVQKNEF